MRTAFLSLLVAILCLLVGAPALAKDESAANINLVLLTDLSGSMKQFQLVEPTQQFLGTFVENVYSGDRVILANFGTEIVVNPAVNVSERNQANDVLALKSVINAYEFSQSHTYTSGALDAACLALSQQNGPKVLILLSDGKEEVPPGSTPKWDNLSKSCTGISIHVIALHANSLPTLQQVSTRLGAKQHDAIKKSLAEIGNEIRAGIRVFVTSDKLQFELGNLTVGAAAETRATFSLSGASQQLELTPVGDFPPGATFNCPNFTAPGDMVCSVLLTDALQPGAYTGKVTFTPVQGNLAVVPPIIEIKFSRGMTQVTASKNDLSLGAMRPGASQVITIDFEANDSASPQPITLSLTGFPDGMVTLEQTDIMAPAKNVELKFTFNSGDPGDYSGQLVLNSTTPTMQVQPAALTVSFHRRAWYSEVFWAYWYIIIPATIVMIGIALGLRQRYVVLPRQREANKPLLKGRFVRPDSSEDKLDPTLDEQTIGGLTYTAKGTRAQTQILVQSASALKVRYPDGSERFTAPHRPINLVHTAVILAADGSEIGTFLCLGLRK